MSRDVVVPADMEETCRRYGFAPAVVAGEWIFVSGQVGRTPAGELAQGPEEQAVEAFKNVQRILECVGAGLGDVVSLTSYHVGLHDQMTVFTDVKARLLEEPHKVSWTAVGVEELASPGIVVEVQATAWVPRPTP